MTLRLFQSNLNNGELDPRIIARTDIDNYYNGLKKARNVRLLPQGGATKRDGTIYLNDAYGDGRVENFSFNTEVNYLLVFTDLRMQIYRDSVLQTNINGSGNDYITTPWSLAQVRDIYIAQSADTAVVVVAAAAAVVDLVVTTLFLVLLQSFLQVHRTLAVVESL